MMTGQLTPTARADYGFADLPRLMALMTGDEKHSFAATSTLDVLWVLYDRLLRIDPAAPDDPARDRFLLSKGHGPMAYYAVLAARGFFPVDWLPGWGAFESPLGQHPDRSLVPGVELASGSLGHGLPIAVGRAAALRTRAAAGDEPPRVYCLVGDAELDEGSNHEAIAIAGRLGVGNLTAIMIDNGSASLGWPGGIAARFATEGWSTREIDGRDHEAIAAALSARSPDRPHCVVATVERKG